MPCFSGGYSNQFSGGNSEWVPPDPFSNSEVKTLSADGSVGFPHVRVGHRQDLFMKSRCRKVAAFFMCQHIRQINTLVDQGQQYWSAVWFLFHAKLSGIFFK